MKNHEQTASMATSADAGSAHIYEFASGWKFFLIGAGAAFMLGGAAGISYFSQQHLPAQAQSMLSMTCLALALLGLANLLMAATYRVRLDGERITVGALYWHRQLERSQIAGIRRLGAHELRRVVLVPRDPQLSPLSVSGMVRTDGAFHDWCAPLVDLEAHDTSRAHTEIRGALYADLPHEEATRRLAQLRRCAQWINGAALAASLIALVLPPEMSWLFVPLVLMPWAAIVLVARYRPLYRFAGRRSSAYADLSLPLITPGLVLMARALPMFHPLAWQALAFSSYIVGAALIAVAAAVDRAFRKQRAMLALALLLSLPYGYALSLAINSWTNVVPVQHYRAQVIAKHVSHGNKSTTWHLTLTPWGPIHARSDVTVSPSLYAIARLGHAVCIEQRQGALQIPWYRLFPCQQGRF
jgi:hypothetical protein